MTTQTLVLLLQFLGGIGSVSNVLALDTPGTEPGSLALVLRAGSRAVTHSSGEGTGGSLGFASQPI